MRVTSVDGSNGSVCGVLHVVLGPFPDDGEAAWSGECSGHGDDEGCAFGELDALPEEVEDALGFDGITTSSLECLDECIDVFVGAFGVVPGFGEPSSGAGPGGEGIGLAIEDAEDLIGLAAEGEATDDGEEEGRAVKAAVVRPVDADLGDVFLVVGGNEAHAVMFAVGEATPSLVHAFGQHVVLLRADEPGTELAGAIERYRIEAPHAASRKFGVRGEECIGSVLRGA